jgi:nucleoside-diphosphate-sugar epimerase
MMSEINLKNKRIAIIGGSGFIGHNMALTLKELGAEVCVVDSLQVNNLGAISSHATSKFHQELYITFINERLQLLRESKVPLYVEDARDYSALSRTLASFKPQVVIHLAAVAHANRSNKDPHTTFDHSLRTLENALDYSRGDGVEHFIYFSSSMIYGNFPGEFVDELTPCEPLGIYGALKYSGEKIVIAYNQVFELPYTIIRPSALYGERCVSGRVGQTFIENAIAGNELCMSGDGSDRLDFTYVKDLVSGICKVIDNKKSHNEIFNITYGDSRSIKDMIEIVKEHFPNINIKEVPKDKLMPSRGTLSVEKANKLIGYEPEWPIEKGFVEYINWYKKIADNHPDLFNIKGK